MITLFELLLFAFLKMAICFHFSENGPFRVQKYVWSIAQTQQDKILVYIISGAMT